MKMRLPIFALLYIIIACTSHEKISGGVDGNPNFLQGQLLFPDGVTPADSVPVILYGTAKASAKRLAASLGALDTAYSDSSGNFQFEIHTDGQYRIDAMQGDSVLYSQDISYSASTGLTLDSIVIPLPSLGFVLIDDFENADGSSTLAAWFDDALAWSSLLRGTDRVDIVPASLRGDVPAARSDCAEQGYCLHFATTLLTEDASTDHNLVYHMLRPYPDQTLALPHADSITVLAKGSGTLVFGLWYVASSVSPSWQTLEKTFTLSTTWQRFSIPLENTVLDVEGTPTPWSAARIHKIVVGLEGAGDLWFDNVQIHGISQVELR